ncbi:hypothetical protein P7C71_g6474, partial [Lecanoromycetidae sp. Uapishka_2]
MSSENGELSPTTTRTQEPASPTHGANDVGNPNRSSTASSGRIRSASLRFLESSPPSGMWHATGTVLAQAPTPMEIRRGSFGHSGWDGELQRRNSTVSEENVRRLSRTPSAQTPGSLGRTATNPLDTHEEGEEDSGFPQREQRLGEGYASGSNNIAQRKIADTSDGDDDPFSMFVGRPKMDNQAYVPRARTTAEKQNLSTKRRSADPYAIPDDDEDVDELTAPVSKVPSKKFQNLAGETDLPSTENGKFAKFSTAPARASSSSSGENKETGPNEDGVYPNGYKFPPKHSWGESTKIGAKALWKFTLTPLGFLIVIYGLNVVAWGGMLFLLLIGGGQEFMCYPPGSHGVKECNNINSPRRIWIEIDSQILNALFCVTGFGLIPWRFRDLYYLLQFRIRHKQEGLRRLSGIHRSWFRLPGSDELPIDPHASIMAPDTNPSIPIPPSKAPDSPLTGFRAPPTRMWKLDYVIWAYVLNTFLQAVLSGFMWGFNRYTRPSWSTGTFVALACIVAGLGGLMCFQEGKRVKAVEGIPVNEAEVLKDVEKDVVEGEKNDGGNARRGHMFGKGKAKDGEKSTPEVSDAA